MRSARAPRALILAGVAATIAAAFLPWVTVSAPLVGLVIAALAPTAAWRAVLALGLLVSVAGLLLVVYMANVIDIGTRGSGEVARLAADALLDSAIGPGTPVLLGGGIATVLGALARGRA